MNLKFAIKSLSNIKWVAASLKPFFRALLLIIFVNALSSLGSVVIAIASKNIVDNAVSGAMDRVVKYALVFVGIVIFNLAVSAFLSVYSTRIQEQYSNTLRQSIFSKLINMEWLQVSKYHSGDLLTRLTSDIGTVTNGSISILSQVISLGVQMVAAFITLMYYEPKLAILAFLLAPFTILLSRFYGRKLSHLHIKMQEMESSYRSNMQEYLQNLLVLKTYNLEEQSLEKVGELQKERLRWVTERSKTGATANTILALGYWAGYITAFGWGILKLSNKTATFGTLTAFLQLVNQIQSPFIGLSRTLPQIIAALASAGRLIEIENLNCETKGDKLAVPSSGGIRFESVSFNYEKDEKVLDNISMVVSPGEITALIGTSGEGKTTILRLMLALLKPDNGKIVCFDRSGLEYPVSSSTRNWFSYVPQGNTLFSGTIAANLRSGKPDASEDELKTALKAACAMDFVEKLPEGVNTLIGEKAYGLSEGQAQRIAIARALLRDAPVIVLDEATSALDIEIEEKVIQGIRDLKPARTCIMITHRKTSLGVCSRIYKLKDGVVSESVTAA